MIDKALLKLIGKDRKMIFQVVALLIVKLLCNLCITGGICLSVHFFLNDGEWIAPLALSALGVAGRFVCSLRLGERTTKLGNAVKTDLRARAYAKMLRLGVRSTEEMSMAGLTQITVEGIEQLDLYYSAYLPQFFYAMIAPILLFLLCVWIDWRTSLVLLCCVPLIPVSIVAVSKYAKKIFGKYWGKYTSMGDGFLDAVQGLRELKLFRADAARNARMNEQAEAFRRITMKVLIMQLASTTIMDLVAYGGAGAGICCAVLAAVRGGAPAASLFLVLVAVDFFLPLRSLGSAFHVAMNGASAGQKILQLLDAPEPQWGALTPQGGALTLENVNFSYDGTRQVLQNVGMTFPEHAMTAIVGESGAGKSTVVSLLTGAQVPQSGSVRLGGTPITQLRREDYYARVAIVRYDTYLFHATVRENFRLTSADVTDAEIWQALEQVNLAEEIRRNGALELVLSEEAANLSGGQRQRLALAIALAADRSIYILDEATSNIDVESEAIIMRVVTQLAAEKTVIVISHRLANVAAADDIYLLANGSVAERGTHVALLEQNGAYALLYRTQCALEAVGGQENACDVSQAQNVKEGEYNA